MTTVTTPRDVEIISICALLDTIRPRTGKWNPQADREAVAAWCEANGAYHYAASREFFSRSEAVCLAFEAGKAMVVVEDLS